MMRHIGNLSAYVLLLVAALLLVFRCSEVPTSPDVPDAIPVAALPATGNVQGDTAQGESLDCDAVGLQRSGIQWTVDTNHQLSLFVPMSPLAGEPYVNVWTPEVNETLLGNGPANKWFTVSLPGFGLWKIRLAAETVIDGKLRQCDRHQFEVIAEPPGCIEPCEPPPPECDLEPKCEARISMLKNKPSKVWIDVKWDYQNWCGIVELVRGDGAVLKAWEACAECVQSDQGRRKHSFDSKDPDNLGLDWYARCVQD